MTTRFIRFFSCIILVSASTIMPAQAEPLKVVTSFSILADMTREIGGQRISVTPLIGADEDAHGYQPRPSDIRKIKTAGLIITNGLGFDNWIERHTDAAGKRDLLVIASEGVTPLATDEAHDDGHGHEEEGHGLSDPHAWQDVSNARHYVRNITVALSHTDPEGAAEYQANAKRYDATLQDLDADIRSALAGIPPEQRKFVTSHDAFGYFGKAYGLQISAAAGLSSEAEPSAAGIAELIRRLKHEQISAVFIENISDPRMIERVAKESGARMGGRLYSDALSGPDGPAATYVQMMRRNLATILTAFSPRSAEQKE